MTLIDSERLFRIILISFLGLIDALKFRLETGQRPFGIHETNAFEKILADGLYAVFHRHAQKYFGDEQFLVVNGNDFCK